jgi:hypothetical protein
MSRRVAFAALLLVSSLLGGCQIGARSAGVFKPAPAPLPPSLEGEAPLENKAVAAAEQPQIAQRPKASAEPDS